MNKREQDRLIARLERESKAAPETYRLKVVLLAALGYAYILLIVGLALGSLAWAAWYALNGAFLEAVKVGLLGALVSLLLLPALWVQLPEPRGRILTRSDSPRLLSLIDKIRSKAQSPRIHQVVLNDSFNTAIVQIPRLGVLGWHRNVLIIGLPMLQALSRKEFAAILAHEFGHLSGRHGQLGTWIYRIRTLWMRVHESFGERGGMGLVLTHFLRWYIPYFNAYSFVLARQDEYEADRLAAAIVGPRILADALISIAVRGRFIEERFWPDLWARADRHLTPSFLPHSSMRTALHLGLDEKLAESWLSEELRRDTGSADTHPCLRERILALRTPCELPPESTHSAAQSLLGDSLPELQHAFDGLWLQHNEVRWRERYHTVSTANETTRRLSQRDLDKLHPDELGHYALALETLGRPDEALPLLCRAADHPHGPAKAALAAARILHGRNDESTIRYLELAMQRDLGLIAEATTQAAAFYEARGDTHKAGAYWQRLAAL